MPQEQGLGAPGPGLPKRGSRRLRFSRNHLQPPWYFHPPRLWSCTRPLSVRTPAPQSPRRGSVLSPRHHEESLFQCIAPLSNRGPEQIKLGALPGAVHGQGASAGTERVIAPLTEVCTQETGVWYLRKPRGQSLLGLGQEASWGRKHPHWALQWERG